jgi:hypothetical protein
MSNPGRLHLLRASLATSAPACGASERVIVAQARHRSADMVRKYIREGSLLRGEWTELWERERSSRRQGAGQPKPGREIAA